MTHTVKAFFNKIKRDRFYRNATLYTVASLVASVLNYVYYPILARMVGAAEFGELQIVTSLLLQLSTVFAGLNLISISLVSNNNGPQGRQLIIALQKAIIWLFFFIFLVVIISSPLLASYFHFRTPVPFMLMAPALLISAMTIFWTAYLQAKEDFLSLSAYALATSLGKIIGSVLLVFLGYQASGAAAGISIGLCIGLVSLLRTARHPLPPLLKTLAAPTKNELAVVRKHARFIGSVIVSLVILSTLLSVDSLIVKRLFDPNFAGNYAGVSTLAKVIFFASAPLVGIMLPAIKLGKASANNWVFWKTLRLSLFVSLCGLLVFSLFPAETTRIFLGEKFVNASQYLPLISLLNVLSTLLNIQLNYVLALRDEVGPVLIFIALGLSLALTSLYHADIYQIVISLCVALGVSQGFFWIYYWFKRKHRSYSASW